MLREFAKNSLRLCRPARDLRQLRQKKPVTTVKRAEAALHLQGPTRMTRQKRRHLRFVFIGKQRTGGVGQCATDRQKRQNLVQNPGLQRQKLCQTAFGQHPFADRIAPP